MAFWKLLVHGPYKHSEKSETGLRQSSGKGKSTSLSMISFWWEIGYQSLQLWFCPVKKGSAISLIIHWSIRAGDTNVQISKGVRVCSTKELISLNLNYQEIISNGRDDVPV